MPSSMPHQLAGQHLMLSSDHCIFWEEEKTLLMSDLHLGKTGHFRKSGIGVPAAVYLEDLHRLFAAIRFFRAETLVVIGDMFHSHANQELELFCKWRRDFSWLNIRLVKGNHDILSSGFYEQAGIQIVPRILKTKPFAFIHDHNDLTAEEKKEEFFFSGHVHPAIGIQGKGRQSVRFPCFHFGKQHALLPAFSRFCGHHTIRPRKGDSIYALLPAGGNGESSRIVPIPA
jgi:DNA ligase-associated metallophosphoesterase